MQRIKCTHKEYHTNTRTVSTEIVSLIRNWNAPIQCSACMFNSRFGIIVIRKSWTMQLNNQMIKICTFFFTEWKNRTIGKSHTRPTNQLQQKIITTFMCIYDWTISLCSHFAWIDESEWTRPKDCCEWLKLDEAQRPCGLWCVNMCMDLSLEMNLKNLELYEQIYEPQTQFETTLTTMKSHLNSSRLITLYRCKSMQSFEHLCMHSLEH